MGPRRPQPLTFNMKKLNLKKIEFMIRLKLVWRVCFGVWQALCAEWMYKTFKTFKFCSQSSLTVIACSISYKERVYREE